MTNAIVISRFNENIEWVEEFNSKYKVIIYNKGGNLDSDINCQIINISNVGREAHTWVYHIYKNYDQIDDNTVFLQGRINDLGCMAFIDINKYFLGLEKQDFCVSRFGLLTPFHWKKNLGIHKDPRYEKNWNSLQISKNKDGFRKFSTNLFGYVPIICPTSYGGCFAVSKSAILKYPKEFYLNLLNILDHHIHPIEAHYMERLWCYMFSNNKFLKKAFIDVLKTKIERNILRKK